MPGAPVTLVASSPSGDRELGTAANPIITTTGQLLSVSDLSRAPFDAALGAAGQQVLIAAQGAGKISRLHELRLQVSAPTVITIRNGAAGAVLETVRVTGANGATVNMPFRTRSYWATSANTALVLESSAAVQVTGCAEWVAS